MINEKPFQNLKPLEHVTTYFRFVWSNDDEILLLKLKESVMSEPVLKKFQEDYLVIVTTYGCKAAIGAVLEHDFSESRFSVAYSISPEQ